MNIVYKHNMFKTVIIMLFFCTDMYFLFSIMTLVLSAYKIEQKFWLYKLITQT